MAIRMLIVQGDWSQCLPFWWVMFAKIPVKRAEFKFVTLHSHCVLGTFTWPENSEIAQYIRTNPASLMNLFYYINMHLSPLITLQPVYLISQSSLLTCKSSVVRFWVFWSWWFCPVWKWKLEMNWIVNLYSLNNFDITVIVLEWGRVEEVPSICRVLMLGACGPCY